MPVIDRFEDHIPKPVLKGPGIIMRAVTVIVTVIFAILHGASAWMIIEESYKDIVQIKVGTGFIAVFTALTIPLMLRQAFVARDPWMLFILYPLSIFATYATIYATGWFFPDAVELNNRLDSSAISGGLLYLNTFLLIWDRGIRIERGPDDLMETLRSAMLTSVGLFYIGGHALHIYFLW